MPDQPNGWSCCQCGSGPYLWQLFRACTNMECRHVACTWCKPEFLKEADLSTNITEDQPICSASVGANSPSTRAISTSDGGQDCVECIHSTAIDQSGHSVSVASMGSLAPGSELAYDESLPAPSLLPSQHITTLPEHFPSGPENQPVDGEWLWVCSECGSGSWLLSNTPACLTCGHIRCYNCSSWEV